MSDDNVQPNQTDLRITYNCRQNHSLISRLGGRNPSCQPTHKNRVKVMGSGNSSPVEHAGLVETEAHQDMFELRFDHVAIWGIGHRDALHRTANIFSPKEKTEAPETAPMIRCQRHNAVMPTTSSRQCDDAVLPTAANRPRDDAVLPTTTVVFSPVLPAFSNQTMDANGELAPIGDRQRGAVPHAQRGQIHGAA